MSKRQRFPRYTRREDVGRIAESPVFDVINRTHSVTAEVVVPDSGAEGVIISQGGITGGWMLYAHEGKPEYCYNFLGLERTYVEGERRIPSGTHQLRMEFEYDGGGLGKGGTVTIYVDGEKSGAGRIERTEPIALWAEEAWEIGREAGSRVTAERGPRAKRFSGEVNWVEIDLHTSRDIDQEIAPAERFHLAMARQ